MRPRDAALQGIVEAAIRSDERLADLPIEITIADSVVHVDGSMPTGKDRNYLRHVLSRIRGPRAIWDILQIESDPAPRVIDLGCGPNKQHATALGVDRHAQAGVDIVTNLETGLPFADTVDYVFAVHFLEHVQQLVGLMNEIHRVLKPDGVLHALVPAANSINALADPTHVRQFNLQTFRYFCEPHPGVRHFRPICAGRSDVDLFADLQPVKRNEPEPDAQELALFFE